MQAALSQAKISQHGRLTFSRAVIQFLRFLFGKSFLASILRVAIGYLGIVFVVAIVGLISPTLGAWLTILLMVSNAIYLYRLSEDRWTFVRKQALPVFVTLVLAGLLNQGIDYAFSMLYAGVVFARAVGVL